MSTDDTLNADDTFEAIFGIDDNEDAFSGDLDGADLDAARKGPRTLDNLDRKLESMIRELRWAKRCLPALTGADPTGQEDDETLIAQIDLLVVASWVRHSPHIDLAREPFRAIVLRGARELGVKPWTKVAPTLDDLLAAAPSAGVSAIAAEPAANVGKVKTTQTALALLQQVFVLPGSIRLDAIFGDVAGYAQKKAALLLSETDPKASARLAAELDRLNAAAVALIEANALPDEFSARLRVLVEKSNLSLDEVAKRCDTYVNRLRHLLRGSQPRLDMGPFIGRLEGVLGVNPGTLWRLVKSPGLRIPTDAVYDDVKQILFKAANVPADILGADWTDLSDAEKEHRIDWVTDNIIFGTLYRRLQRIEERLTFRHAELKDFMLAEFTKVEAFKTATVPPADFFPRKVELPGVRRRTIKHGGRWREKTALMVENYIRASVTALKSVCADHDNAWLKDSGLGFLIFPQVQRAIAEQMARRRCQQLLAAKAFRSNDFSPPKDGEVYTVGDVNRIELTAGLFNPLTGYLFHNPPRFAPIPGVLTQSDIDAAVADWAAFVKRSRTKIREISNGIAEAACRVRDPWLPIEPLLALPDPLSPVYQGLDRMAADRPSFFGTPLACARHDQAHLVMSLLVHSCLRRANFGKLTWRSDNSGNLRWSAEGTWILQIPQRDMKNEGSGALPDNGNDLILELNPEDPELYSAIDRWLGPVDRNTGIVDEVGSSRRLIHGNRCGEKTGYALFPSEASEVKTALLGTGEPAAARAGRVGSARQPMPVTGVTDQTIGTIVYKFSTQYLVRCPWQERGVAGVLPFGPHALRDLVATHVLKNTGSIDDAAGALFDTPETLSRHYARFTSLEKSRRINATIRRTIKREPGAGRGAVNPTKSTAAAGPAAQTGDRGPTVEQSTSAQWPGSTRRP